MTTDEQGYNGWTNYETWAMALWIDNDQSTYTAARDLTREVIRTYGTSGPSTTAAVADALKEWQEQAMPALDASVWSDLLAAAFGNVDWFEIARHYIQEVTEDD